MEWTWHDLIRCNALGVHWLVGAVAAAVVVAAVLRVGWLLMRAVLRRRELSSAGGPDSGDAPAPREPAPPSAPLPVSPGFSVIHPANADLGAILGTGTPTLGPAPPAVGFEQQEHVLQADDAVLTPPWLEDDEP